MTWVLSCLFVVCCVGVVRSQEDEWDIILVETGERTFDLFSKEVSQFASKVEVALNGPELVDSTNIRYTVLDELAKRKGDILKISYEPVNDMTFYASATCVTTEGETCGFQTMPIKPFIDNHISWMPYTVLMHPKFSHVEWHLLRRKDDLSASDVGLFVTLSYVTAENSCQTTFGTCNSLCFNGKCGVRNHFHEIACECVEPIKKGGDDDWSKGKVVILIVVMVSVLVGVGAVCVLAFCCSRRNREDTARQDAPHPEEVSEARAEELVLNFPKYSPTGSESCCVCLLGEVDNSPDGNVDDSEWIITPCGHPMHAACIRLWFQQRRSKMQFLSCPVCRSTLDGTKGSVNVSVDEEALPGDGSV